jgi:hypothetical protein
MKEPAEDAFVCGTPIAATNSSPAPAPLLTLKSWVPVPAHVDDWIIAF